MNTHVETLHPGISLKAICTTTGLCYQYVLKAARKPQANQPYDPAAFNYEAINKILEQRQIDLDSYDWSTVALSRSASASAYSPEDFPKDTQFELRETREEKQGIIYAVLLTTDTHIVFMATASTQPRVMNWDTFLHQNPRIVATR